METIFAYIKSLYFKAEVKYSEFTTEYKKDYREFNTGDDLPLNKAVEAYKLYRSKKTKENIPFYYLSITILFDNLQTYSIQKLPLYILKNYK